MTALRKATFKHVEAELYAYPDTKKEIKRLREQIMNDTEIDENVGMGSNSVRVASRPTEQIATRLTTNKTLRNLEEISDAIESVYEQLEESQKKLIRLRYWNGRRGFSWERIALECNISERTVYNYRNMIIDAIAERVGWR
ncbi:DUF722 domain-containing protein [Halalkalibacterium ligniniphilum]|uniref:DUF722 domain-containing protein n=1 Tax=Halalkalibacterium ligniniphilum TaxID=1134413 RepID=UPI0003476E92|nr:DUF722 domain-containing protein [Halalkalibacterium ligniniphilum]